LGNHASPHLPYPGVAHTPTPHPLSSYPLFCLSRRFPSSYVSFVDQPWTPVPLFSIRFGTYLPDLAVFGWSRADVPLPRFTHIFTMRCPQCFSLPLRSGSLLCSIFCFDLYEPKLCVPTALVFSQEPHFALCSLCYPHRCGPQLPLSLMLGLMACRPVSLRLRFFLVLHSDELTLLAGIAVAPLDPPPMA